MKKKDKPFTGPTRFGEILSKGGALYVIRSWRDAAYAQMEAVRAKMVMDGLPITPVMEQLMVEKAEKMAAEMEAEYRAKGVPDIFKKLLAVDRKKDVEKYCKSLSIAGSDFSLFIHNCNQLDFSHSRQHLEIVPKELYPTDEEREAFQSNGVGLFKIKAAKKFVKKIGATFDQRKNINAHLFESGDKWHLFWFTFDDAYASQRGKTNHWKG